MTSGSGDRPREEGSHGGGVYSFFPCHSRTLSDLASAAMLADSQCEEEFLFCAGEIAGEKLSKVPVIDF